MAKNNKEKMNKVANYLVENNIDLWLIYSSEGSDKANTAITGIRTIGKTFFIITKEGKAFAIANRIDSLESKNSGLFDEVIEYGDDAGATLKETLTKLAPNSIAVNYSKDSAFCDGLTVGRFKWLKEAIGEEFTQKLVSSEVFLKNFA